MNKREVTSEPVRDLIDLGELIGRHQKASSELEMSVCLNAVKIKVSK